MNRLLIAVLAIILFPQAAAAEIKLTGSGRMGVFWNGSFGTEHRLRLDFTAKTKTDDGITFGAFARASLEKGAAGQISGPALSMAWDRWKLTIGNTSGAVAAQAGIWGCSVGYRGSSCADMVANLSPGGWTPVMTVSSSTGQGPNLVRVNAKFGKVKLALSGANGNDFEIAAAFPVGPIKVGLGFDDGSGTTGGWTLTTEYKKGDWTYGLDAGQYGTVTNGVFSAQYKTGPHTYYGYVSVLGGTHSAGLSYKRDLGGGVKFGTGVEIVGGSWMADMGLSMRF